MTAQVSTRDEGYGWVIVVAFFLIEILVDGIRFSWGLYFVEFLNAFNRTKADTAWIGALMVGTYNLCGPMFAFIVNKVGCRKAGFIGSLVTASGFLLSFFAPNLYMLYFTYGVLQGFGFGQVFLAGTVATGQYFLNKRALAMGIAFCGSGVGTFIIPPVARILIETYTWKGSVFILAGFAANLCVPFALFRPFRSDCEVHENDTGKQQNKTETECTVKNGPTVIANGTGEHDMQLTPLLNPAKSNHMQNGSVSPAIPQTFADLRKEQLLAQRERSELGSHQSLNMSVLSQSILGSNASFERIFEKRQQNKLSSLSIYIPSIKSEMAVVAIKKEKRFRNSVIENMFPKSLVTDINFIIFMISTLFIGIPSFIPFSMLPDYAISIGTDASSSAWLLSAIGIGGTISRLISGWLSDLPCVNRFTLQGVSQLILGLTSIVVALVPKFEILLAYSALYGTFFGSLYVVQPIVLLEYFGEEFISEVMGVLMCVYGVSCFIGSPLAGFIFDMTGSYRTSFLFVGASFSLSAIIHFMVLFTKTGKRPYQESALDVDSEIVAVEAKN